MTHVKVLIIEMAMDLVSIDIMMAIGKVLSRWYKKILMSGAMVDVARRGCCWKTPGQQCVCLRDSFITV